MCDKAGIAGNKTNHSLRAYAATELFNAGVPEKVIQDRTGHRSLDGLRKYETISEQQKEAACKVLAVRSDDPGPECTSVTPYGQANNGASNIPATAAMHTSQAFIRHDSQMVPNFSFGFATLQGCTINVYQAPVQLSQSEAKDLFEGQW